ncbi:MAG: aspartate kinase [Holdemania filiformis]
MEICVIKFGGTSLKEEAARNRAVRLIRRLIPEMKVIAVVSAMGRYPDPYATDTLMSLAKYLTPQQRDRLVSAGEMISTLVINSLCRQNGILSDTLSTQELGIITNDHYGEAEVLTVTTGKLLEKLDHCDCLIVPGYQGITLDHEITTLGRGGSDCTAMLLAQALGLEDVYILTDVSGIYEADPKQNPDARHWDEIDYDQMLKMIDAGARVMQRQSILFAREHQLRVWVGYHCKSGKERGFNHAKTPNASRYRQTGASPAADQRMHGVRLPVQFKLGEQSERIASAELRRGSDPPAAADPASA